MKLVLQIAAGVVLGGIILWVAKLGLAVGAVQAAADELKARTPAVSVAPARVVAPAPTWPPSQAQMDAWNAETDAEASREQRQESRCAVQAANGTTFHCDPHGPFTPR